MISKYTRWRLHLCFAACRPARLRPRRARRVRRLRALPPELRRDKEDPHGDTRASRHLHARLPYPAQRRLLHLVRDHQPHGPGPGHRRGARDHNRLARHHRAQEGRGELRETEARYRTLIEQIPAVTYIDALDDVNSAIYMSPQAESAAAPPRGVAGRPRALREAPALRIAKVSSPNTHAPTRRGPRSSSSTG